jgi:hypothetical protein
MNRGFKLKRFHKFVTLIDEIKNLELSLKYGINDKGFKLKFPLIIVIVLFVLIVI